MYFVKYGITVDDLAVIRQVCAAYDIEPEWFQEYVLAPLQKRRNSGAKMTIESAGKIISQALKGL